MSGFLIPPLMVICVGLALAFAWLSSGASATLAASGQAEQPQASMGQLAAPSNPSQASSGAISPVFSPEIQYWGNSIRAWAASAGLDPNLAATVMQIESCGNPRALSRAGAMGLFQVMPGHFTASDDPYNPDTNALRGLAYLKRSLAAANGNATLALAGYNGGIGVIGRPESSWQPETQHYAALGGAIYREASSGATVSARLQAWLTAGGGSFCRQARTRLGINP
ncbi:MAG TPA: transglycosylase SLT domain-containing protein [Anaerolineales bacterium]|nr:transglycosylase SLT domain-containing protein [Anaerolineales bacterium]